MVCVCHPKKVIDSGDAISNVLRHFKTPPVNASVDSVTEGMEGCSCAISMPLPDWAAGKSLWMVISLATSGCILLRILSADLVDGP